MNKIKLLFALIFVSFISFSQGRREEEESINVDKDFKSAYDLFEQKKYKEAYDAYTLFLNKKPKDYAALYNRGLCSYNLYDYKTGIRDFNESIYLGNKKASTYYMRGLSRYCIDEYDNAIKDFDS